MEPNSGSGARRLELVVGAPPPVQMQDDLAYSPSPGFLDRIPVHEESMVLILEDRNMIMLRKMDYKEEEG